MARKKVCVCCKSIYEESMDKISILCPICRRAGCDGMSQCKYWRDARGMHWERRRAVAAGMDALASFVAPGKPKG